MTTLRRRTLSALAAAAVLAAGCDRLGGPGAGLDRIEDRQKACEETAAGDPTALGACHAATIDAAGKLIGRTTGEARFRKLLSDLYEPLLFARTGGGDALAERVVVSAAFADLAVRRAAILTGVAEGKGPQGTVKPFAGWPDAAAARGLTARWTAIRTADCKAYPVKNCARRLDAVMRRTVRQLKVG